MTSISKTSSSSFLQSQSTAAGSNWVQTAVSASSSSADWMDPTASNGTDPVVQAANAFAATAQASLSSIDSLKVNQGMATLQSQLASVSSTSVNILA